MNSASAELSKEVVRQDMTAANSKKSLFLWDFCACDNKVFVQPIIWLGGRLSMSDSETSAFTELELGAPGTNCKK